MGGQTRKEDVVFHEHYVTNIVLRIETSGSICEQQGVHAKKLHDTYREHDLHKVTIIITTPRNSHGQRKAKNRQEMANR